MLIDPSATAVATPRMLSLIAMDTVENLRKQQTRGLEQFLKFIRGLPTLAPREIYDRLETLGYRGQRVARRAVALMAYRHIRRIKRLHLDGQPREDVLTKSNYLLIGPTGCGKTHLVELLFGSVLKLPTVVVDVTTYSETGYVGQDPSGILTRLLHAADDNPLIASVGIVCLDEFDKLASGQNNSVFAGAGTTKDVTGMGVQRELLKMLEAADIVVPMELGHATYGDHLVMSTADIAFIAAGAFSGLPQLLRLRGRGRGAGIGFGQEQPQGAPATYREDAVAVSLSPEEVEEIAHLQAYGFLPELIARFTRIVPFEALSAETLKEILQATVIEQLRLEFEDEGQELVVDDEVLDWVVAQSVKRETGARGLASILTRVVEDAAFESFASGLDGRVVLRVEGDSVHVTRDQD
jgi:ATP-dependent Clp protease ATP-binding subunit ClpX